VGVALLANLAALGLVFLLDPWLHQGVVVLFLGAVALSAWSRGLGSGLLATAGGVLAFHYFLREPAHVRVMPGRGSADLAVFGLVWLPLGGRDTGHLLRASGGWSDDAAAVVAPQAMLGSCRAGG
jgi:hypothetical protein